MASPRTSKDTETLTELFTLYRIAVFVFVLFAGVALAGLLMEVPAGKDLTGLNWAMFLLLWAGSSPTVPIVCGGLALWAGIACVLLYRGVQYKDRISVIVVGAVTVVGAIGLLIFFGHFYYTVFTEGKTAPFYEFYTFTANMDAAAELIGGDIKGKAGKVTEDGLLTMLMVIVYIFTIGLPLLAMTFLVQATLALVSVPAMGEPVQTIVPGLTVQTPMEEDMEHLYSVFTAYYLSQNPGASKAQVREAWRDLGLKPMLKTTRMFKVRRATIGFYRIDPKARTLNEFVLNPRFTGQGYGAFMYKDLEKRGSKSWIGLTVEPASDQARQFFLGRGWTELGDGRLRAPKR